MATHSGFLPEKFHGQRSLTGYSPWGHKESDVTEQLTFLSLELQKTHSGFQEKNHSSS